MALEGLLEAHNRLIQLLKSNSYSDFKSEINITVFANLSPIVATMNKIIVIMNNA